jgi:PKD repeat protein
MITREQIKLFLQNIASSHYNIHTFGWGDVPDLLARENVIYPYMMVTPVPSTFEDGYINYGYLVSIADRIREGNQNEVEVDSDTFNIMMQVITQIDNLLYNDVDLVKGQTITPFMEAHRHRVSGHFSELQIRVKYNYDSCAIPSDEVPLPLPPPPSCAVANYRVEYENGTLIEAGTIPSGGSKTIEVPDPSICANATWELRDEDGNLLNSGSVASGGSVTIEAPNADLLIRNSLNQTLYNLSLLSGSSGTQTIGDSSIRLEDSVGTLIANSSVVAEGSATITAPNGTVSVRKSDGVEIYSVDVRSNGTASQNVADSVAVIKDSANTTLKSENIKATESENIVINDSSVENSDASYSVNVLAEGSHVIPDSQINVNGVDAGDVVSVKTIDVNITDGVDPVTPTSVGLVGNTLTIEVPSGGGSLAVDFTVDDTTPDTNQTITFTDTTIGATSWVWNFGDGTSSTLQNPTKKYAHSGVYNVTLCASDGTISGEEVKTNFINCSLQALPSANLQMHNAPLIGATPANATLVSGAISQWDDAINSYNRTQGTPANRPTYLYPAITAPNGIVYGAARFDGSNDFLQNNNVAFTRTTGSFEVLVVKRNAPIGVARVILEATTSNYYEFFYVSNTRELGLFNGTVRNNVQSLQIGVWAVIYVHWNEASTFIDWNNKTRGVAPGSPGNNNSVGSTMGATFNGGLASEIDVLEHIIYTAKPSDADITLIQERIVAQYGNIF